MSTPKELIARQQCCLEGHDPDWIAGDGEKLWTHFEGKADSILAVITRAGFAIVPVEPLKRQRDAAMRIIGDANEEQKHLDLGTTERAYWHFGRAVAFNDVIRFATEAETE